MLGILIITLESFSSVRFLLCFMSITIYRKHLLCYKLNNRFYFLPVRHFSAWTGKLPPPSPVSSGWSQPPGFRETGADEQKQRRVGGPGGGCTLQIIILTCLLWIFFCLQPPVASLLAPRVICLPPPPPLPRCPALGSSSVCCKLSAHPEHPATPGRQ